MQLEGKIALVTGGGRGIGRGIVDRFLEEGASVAVVQRQPVDHSLESHPQVVHIQADLGVSSSIGPATERAVERLGGIDILVNNAGIETIVPFLDLTDEQWTRLTDVNLRGNWLCSQVFCRRVVKAGRKASIVNIGSIQSAKVLPGRTHYAPTKLALEALTRNMSAEMTPLGIRVNCVHPGLIDTPMTEWVMKDKEILPLVLAQISLGRAGQPREVGAVVAFFASDEASYLTGQSVHVDGGWAGK